MIEAKQQAAQGLLAGIGNQSMGMMAARESTQTIVDNMIKQHSRELSGWSWLKTAMEKVPPSSDEETALWDLVCRARRERY